MTPRHRNILLAASLALNIGFTAIAVQRHWPGDEPAQAAAPLTQRLGLSPGQQAAWAALEAPFLEDLAENWADIRAQRQALLDEVFSARPDAARLDGIQAKIARLQDAQQKRVIRQLLAERSVLDPGQQAMLKDLLMQEFAAQATRVEQLHQTAPAIR